MSMLVPVNVMAGWIASGMAPAGPRRGEDVGPEARGGVQHELAGLPGLRGGESRDQALELGIRHGDDHEFAALDDFRHGQDRHEREDRLGPVAALLRDRGDPHDGMAGAGQGRAEDGADASGADDADSESSGSLGHSRAPVGWFQR